MLVPLIPLFLAIVAGELPPPTAESSGDVPLAAPVVREASTVNCWQLSTGQPQAVIANRFSSFEGQVVVPVIPRGSAGSASSAQAPLSGNGAGGGSLGSGEALLAIAVLAVAVAPVVVYVLDSPADPEVALRYRCPQVDVRFLGGAVSLPSDPSRMAVVGGVRTAFEMGAFGVDASFESTRDAQDFGNLEVHLRLRPPPKKHIEGAVAVGYRRAVFGGAQRDGFEIGLPHHYILTRYLLRPLTVDLHPALFVNARGLDFRLEAGLSVPIGVAVLQLGGRVFSFDEYVRAGAYLGVGFNL